MASEHELTNLAAFELFAGEDYSDRDAKFTDATVESWISQGENQLIGSTKFTWTSANMTSGAKALLNDFIQHYADNAMIKNSHAINGELTKIQVLSDLAKDLILPNAEEGRTSKRLLFIDRN